MRDPNRIYDFCNRLAAVWSEFPDWRFGQFICNVFGAMQGKGRDPFFPEDNEMIEFIEGFVKE